MRVEYWKAVVGYEGVYEVSNYGRVKRLSGYSYVSDKLGRKYKRFIKEKILKPVDVNKYKRVSLSKGGVIANCFVHILMMNAFGIPNPNNYPEINHKDENPSNNFIYINPDGSFDLEKSNLEWCDRTYNVNYGTCPQRISDKNSKKPVLQYDLEGNLINRWKSLMQIERTLGFSSSNISNSINGKGRCKHPYGFLWKHA